jgi:hypothetical protein
LDDLDDISYEMWEVLNTNISDIESNKELNTMSLKLAISNKNIPLIKAVLDTKNYDGQNFTEWWHVYMDSLTYDYSQYIDKLVSKYFIIN